MGQPRFVVTGGSGFIGTWVVRELLARDAGVVVYDRGAAPDRWRRILGEARASRVTLVPGDLTDRERLGRVCDEHDVSHVIHLAALLTPACQQDPWAACQVNVLGTVAVFEVARARRERIQGLSYASSLAVFGPEADDQASLSASRTSAGAPAENQPPTFYGATKKAVELLAHQYWVHHHVRSVGIRPHVVYGPERDQGISAGPSLAARAAARREPYTIGFTGSLGYDYVEDVARAFVDTALATPAGAAVVDLPSIAATPEEIVEVLATLAPDSAGLLSVSGPAIPSNVPPVPSPITRLLPAWRATTLREGLQRTLSFYQ